MDSWFQGILVAILIGLSVLMTFFILLQEGKGGGLAGLGGTKAAGVEGVTNPIRRFTGYLAALWFLIAIVLGVIAQSAKPETDEEMFDPEAPAMGAAAKEKDEKAKKPEPGPRRKMRVSPLPPSKKPAGKKDGAEPEKKVGETSGKKEETQGEKKPEGKAGTGEKAEKKESEPAAATP